MLSAGSRRLATLIAPFFDNLPFAILLSRRFPACTQQGIFRYSINISKKLLPNRNVRTKADVGAKLWNWFGWADLRFTQITLSFTKAFFLRFNLQFNQYFRGTDSELRRAFCRQLWLRRRGLHRRSHTRSKAQGVRHKLCGIALKNYEFSKNHPKIVWQTQMNRV